MWFSGQPPRYQLSPFVSVLDFPKEKVEAGETVRPEEAHHADGDDLVVGQGALACDHARAPQVLHAQAVVLPNDVRDDVPGEPDRSENTRRGPGESEAGGAGRGQSSQRRNESRGLGPS